MIIKKIYRFLLYVIFVKIPEKYQINARCHPEPVEGELTITILKLRQAQFDKNIYLSYLTNPWKLGTENLVCFVKKITKQTK